MSKIVSPQVGRALFFCSSCGGNMQHSWYPVLVAGLRVENWQCSRCTGCGLHSLWDGDRLVYPATIPLPSPHTDMSAAARNIFDEARRVACESPRAAMALLRLSAEIIVSELSGRKSLDDGIGELVSHGLRRAIQQGLDVVRVTGNKSVHPGKIEDEVSLAEVETLMEILNMIIEQVVSEPKHIEALYSRLPQGARDAIDRRDGASR